MNRSIVGEIKKRLVGKPRYIQLVSGPRQVGKTTALRKVIEDWGGPTTFAAADTPAPPSAYWIESQWALARKKVGDSNHPSLLVLDEIQKIHRWSETVKGCWDQDRSRELPLHVVILGSSSLLLQEGAQESLAGRFENHYCSHWNWPESREAFGWDLDHWLYFGGYPGAAPLTDDLERWKSYITNSLIESVLSRDVFQMTQIAKPALFRQLFGLAARVPAQILSYNKMLGQLQDAGNATTLAHYLDLLKKAYLVSGLPIWTGGIARVRAASPKLIVWNNALLSALSSFSPDDLLSRPDLWGHWVENAVGAHLLNQPHTGLGVYYWRNGPSEVDFVLERGERLLAIEVKSGAPGRVSGLEAFTALYPRARALIIGSGGIPLEDFFKSHVTEWI